MDMAKLTPFALLLFVFACSKITLLPKLSDQASFSGEVVIQVIPGKPEDPGAEHRDSMRGDLAFDRANGNLQWTIRKTVNGTASATSVLRNPKGEIKCFRNAEPSAVTDPIREQFQLIETLVALATKGPSKAVTALERSETSYDLEVAGVHYRISTSKQAVLRGH